MLKPKSRLTTISPVALEGDCDQVTKQPTDQGPAIPERRPHDHAGFKATIATEASPKVRQGRNRTVTCLEPSEFSAWPPAIAMFEHRRLAIQLI
jgi:hypothetical protein